MAIDKKVVGNILLEPTHVKNILAIKNACHTKIGCLKASVIKSDEPIKFQDLDNSQFVSISSGKKWANKYGCAWFHFTGKVPEKGKGKHVVLRIKLHGEGLIYNPDGTVVQGITQVISKGDVFHSTIGKQIIDISNNAEGGEAIDYYVDAGFNGVLRFQHIGAHLGTHEICIENDDVIQYFYDYEDLFFLMLKLGQDSERYKELSKELKASFRIYKKEGVKAAREYIAKFQYKEGDYAKTQLYSIGHGHIDLAWLWPIRETKRKIARTFGNQIRNINKYPGYIFAESQPQMFKWLKEGYPDLYEKVKEQVKAGRIELQGANWVEGDVNLSGGESWVRQSLYGQKFWKEEFDFKSNMCWLPDVFGFPASLPQVLQKCGMKYFMTIKLISNTVNQFPYKTFIWEGIDGSQVLAHMEPQGDYNSGATAFALYKSDARNTERDTVPIALQIFGDGDGGGGPSEGHIEFVKRHKVCHFSKAVNFFDDLEKEKDIIATHHGELYYERHQGTYTSQANSKKWNRRIEEQLHKLEWLGSYAYLKGIKYDRAKVEEIWKEVLLYQFHDILPGSSIKRVYDESIARYIVMSEELAKMEKELIEKLSKDSALMAINPVDFARVEYIKKEDKWYSANLNKYSTAELVPVTKEFTSLSAQDNVIENNLVKVAFNRDGSILSFYDKVNDKELVKDYFNKFIVFSDPFMYYNAWDIKMNYRDLEKWEPHLTDAKTYIDGPCVVRENTYTFNKSKIIQKVIITDNDPMVKFDTTVDWHENMKMLRTEFIPTVYADNVTCNIPFGNFDRTTHEDDSVQKAQFEICAQKYINLDDKDYGWALLNNCKYGHRVKNGLVSLALLRSPKFPDPTCDRGLHRFTYAVLPHKEKFAASDVLARGYTLNNEIEIIDKKLDVAPIISASARNITIETIKVSENEEGLIVRAYETTGKKTSCKFTTSEEFKETYETDMLENIEKTVDLQKQEFGPYEIKTFFLKK